jgi:hypothetical protein
VKPKVMNGAEPAGGDAADTRLGCARTEVRHVATIQTPNAAVPP